MAACRAQRRVGTSLARRPVIEALSDKDQDVRNAAAGIVREARLPPGLEMLPASRRPGYWPLAGDALADDPRGGVADVLVLVAEGLDDRPARSDVHAALSPARAAIRAFFSGAAQVVEARRAAPRRPSPASCSRGLLGVELGGERRDGRVHRGRDVPPRTGRPGRCPGDFLLAPSWKTT